MYFDLKTGKPKKSKVYLICGAPASGKSTYVNEHKSPGDMVVDLDLIRQALGAPHKTSSLFQKQILQIRDLLYDEIQFNNVGCENIWVISGLPDSTVRQQTARRLNAEIIFMKTSLDECIKRASLDGERIDKETQYRIISEYFEKLN